MGILYALITIIAWGTWLAPSQKIVFKNQQIKTFYVAVANLALSALVFTTQPAANLTWALFWPPFLGGLIWAVSGFLAFTAADRLGMARAFGLWTPINVIVSILWGILLFNEFLSLSPTALVLLVAAVVILLTGVLLIVFAKGFDPNKSSRRSFWIGIAGAIGAGVLWGTYFIPIKLSTSTMWVLSLPLSIGIFTGSAILLILTRQPVALQSTGQYLRVTSTGLLWGIGNYGMLLLVESFGAGRGFTISQLGVVVNALIGIYILKDPHPRTAAAIRTLAGCILACIGGVLLGSLK